MSPREEIAALLDEWGRLSQSEGVAIQSAAWNRVKEIQSAKYALRQPIDAAMQKWRAQTSPTSPQNPFKEQVGRLLSLQNRNRSLIADQKKRAHAQMESLQQARLDLRRVRRTYARTPQMAGGSYS